jgi:hypothetical protein
VWRLGSEGGLAGSSHRRRGLHHRQLHPAETKENNYINYISVAWVYKEVEQQAADKRQACTPHTSLQELCPNSTQSMHMQGKKETNSFIIEQAAMKHSLL